MKNWNGILKTIAEKKLLGDILNIIMGIVVVIFIIMAFINPTSKFVIGGVFFLGGMLNIGNGLKYQKDKKTKPMGMSMITIGTIILFAAVYIFGTIL